MCACLNCSGSCSADIRRCISVNRQLECKPLASDSICRQSAKTLPLRGIVKFLTTGTGLEPSPDPTRAVGCDWTSRVKTGTELDCLTTNLLLKGLWSGSKTQRSETGFHQGCDWTGTVKAGNELDPLTTTQSICLELQRKPGA